MLTTRSRKAKLERVDDEALKARLAAAEATVREIDALPPAKVRGREKDVLGRYEKALAMIDLGRAELATREHEHVAANAPARRALRDEEDARRAKHKALAPVLSSLEFVRRRAHTEVRGCTLVADRLSPEEGAELAALVAKQRAVLVREDAEPLSEAEESRYEELVGVAADDREIFERKREEVRTRAKIAEIAKARRRHPQAESLVAAVMGDPDLFDLLHERLREGVLTIDEYGRESRGVATVPILSPEHVAALSMLVNLIAENGGREIVVRDTGLVERRRDEGRLPFLPVRALAQLKRNAFVTVRAEGSQRIVGPGSRMRALAKKWGIALPETTENV